MDQFVGNYTQSHEYRMGDGPETQKKMAGWIMMGLLVGWKNLEVRSFFT